MTFLYSPGKSLKSDSPKNKHSSQFRVTSNKSELLDDFNSESEESLSQEDYDEISSNLDLNKSKNSEKKKRLENQFTALTAKFTQRELDVKEFKNKGIPI